MRGRTFYTMAGGITSGIFLRSLFDISITFALALMVSATAVALIWYARSSTYATPLFFCSLFFLCTSLGVIRFEVSTWHDWDAQFAAQIDRKVVVEGVIVREADVRARTAQLTVDVQTLNGERADERVLVITDRFPAFAYGERLRVSGTLEVPETFETDLGRMFDYPGYLSARGITYIIPFADVERMNGDTDEGGALSVAGSAVAGHLLALKHAFMERIEILIPEPQAGLAEGLVLGVKRALGDDLEDAFRVTGIIHIVVLSGYNVTIVAEAIMRLLSFFFLPRTRVVFGVVAIAAFAFVAGFSATVVRASLMAVLVLAARATGRAYAVTRALVFAGLVMLIINPKLLVFDPGFQLSFLATLGLILLAPILEQKIEERFSLVPTRFQIREFVTATIATQVFVLPLLLYSIGQFSVVAVFVNVLVLPAVPLAMLLTFLSGMLSVVSIALAFPLAYFAYLVLSYIIAVAEWFAALPFAAVAVPAFPFWVTVFAYALLAYYVWRIHGTLKVVKQ